MILPLTPVRFLYRAIDLYGKKTGVISGDKRFTYAEFGNRCGRLAGALKVQGLKPGDRVGYLSFNTHQLLEAYFGIPLAGGIVAPLNVRLSPAELIQILNHSEARFLFLEQDFAPLIESFRRACPVIERFVSLDQPLAGAELTSEELLADAEAEYPNFLGIDENSTAELFYTSGSTGSPKGVMLSHRTLYLHAMGIAAAMAWTDAGVELHTIPLFHANGWGRPQVATMLGMTQVMVRRFEPGTVFRLIQEERATGMSLVPTMANALLNSPELGRYDVSSMQEIMFGGAAASPELVERMEQAFRCRCISGYGLTETSPVATTAREKCTVGPENERSRLNRLAMAGWPLPGVEVRVVDPDMNDVPRDMQTIGEVVVRGDEVMDGYYKDPEGTAAVMSEEWFHTGDMAVWDEETFIHIVDRKKDIIVSGGENISTLEVEKAIFAHPAVLECAVVAAPDPNWGEVPAAFIVLKPGHSINKDQLCEFLDTRIGRFKIPRIFEFLDNPLPKTGTGKIVKRALREPFWAGKERRVQG
jgi:fatty-acyl-CoA synthase